MALFSSHTSMVQRSKGQNAIAAAAYNSRSKLTLWKREEHGNEFAEIAWDYSSKEGLSYSKIHAPTSAPKWVHDRQLLWNAAEAAEVRIDGQPARKIMLALPIELSEEQNIDLLEEFTSKLVELGMVVDVNMHMDNPENPHAHLMMTTREFTENKYGEYEFSKVKNRDWGKPAFVNWHRELWAELTNNYLYKYGFDARVTHKSYKQLGLDIEPGKHEGPARNIKRSELRRVNQAIALTNCMKLEANPSIILDKLAINRPVFTKDDIAKELDKILFAGTSFDGISNKEKGDLEAAIHQDFASKYMQLYTRIIDSSDLTLVTEKDLYGRALYTTTKRFELEKRYIDNVESLYDSSSHKLHLTVNDLEKQTVKERITANITDKLSSITTSVIEQLQQTTGISFKLLDTKATANHPLSDEQVRGVLEVLQGRDISVLEGLPGAGKTTAMREIVRQYKQRGYKVIGVAPSSSAALQLAKETGIESKNASLWRKEWLAARGQEFELVLSGDYYKEDKYQKRDVDISNVSDSLLTNKHVMIIDEASMGELSHMDYLIDEAKQAGAKVILVGDDNQLSAVGFAGALKKTISICGSSTLEESRRQDTQSHRDATKLLSQYKVEQALDIYRKEGSIIIDTDTRASDRHLVADYIDAYLHKAAELSNDNLAATRELVICTYTNSQSNKFNHLIRQQLKEAGVIKGRAHQIVLGNRMLELGIGEQIVFTRNLNQMGKSGIFNGEVGSVVNIKTLDEYGHALVSVLVNKADGSKEGITIDTSQYSKGSIFNYGYAVTAHKLQGATVDTAYIAHEKQMGFETINVLLTRHRRGLRLYTSHDILPDYIKEGNKVDDPLDQSTYNILVGLSSRRANNSMAIDYGNPGLSRADHLLEEYIDHNSRSSRLMQKIATDNARRSKIEQDHIAVYEHELWDEFKATKDIRDKVAGLIVGDFDQYKDRLQQLGINYHNVQRHAGLSSNTGIEQKEQQVSRGGEMPTPLTTYSTKYHSLFTAIDIGDSTKLKHIYNDMQTDIASIHLQLEKHFADIIEIKEERAELEDVIYAESNFRLQLMPNFISRIYKHAPGVALHKWENLVENNGLDQAVTMVEKTPSLIGEVRGRGLGMFVGLDQERRNALENYKNLGKQLRAYINSSNIEDQTMRKIREEAFAAKLNQIENEIDTLKRQLPTELQELFLQEVGEAVNSYQGTRQHDISKLQESELYNAVKLDAISDNKHNDSLDQNSYDRRYDQRRVAKGYNHYKQFNKQNHPRLEFREVKEHLSDSVIEQIFRDHAVMLNPDGNFKRNNGQLSCGSLNINLQNGLWYRFSDSSSGDIFSLIEVARSISKKEALSVVAEYCGVGKGLDRGESGSYEAVNKYDNGRKYRHSNYDQESKVQSVINKDPWQVVAPIDVEKIPLLNPKEDLEYLTRKADIELLHEYRNEYNHLLGYAIRIRSHDTGKKQVLPVAYCYNEEREEYAWRLKGFNDKGYKAIYGAEKLLEHSVTTPVLIVEGEKTADIAQRLLPDHIVVSWMGGSSSVNRVCWPQLAGREVIIWPDNDTPGIKAAHNIKEHLDYANGFSGKCHIVDTQTLDLPEKWDLADKLPDHLNDLDISSVLSHTKQQSFNNLITNATRLSARREESAEWRKLLSSLDILIAKGRVDDAYNKHSVINKELYKATLAILAVNKGLDVSDRESFIDNIRKLQQDYDKLMSKSGVLVEQYSDRPLDTKLASDTKSVTHTTQLLKEASIYHQAVLNISTTSKLPALHQSHINETVYGCCKQFNNANKVGQLDITSASNKLYKDITSYEWLKQLDHKTNDLLQFMQDRQASQNIDGSLKYIVSQPQQTIESSEHNPQQQLQELQKLTSHVSEHGILPEKHLLAKLQTSNDANTTHQSLKALCVEHHTAKIYENVHALMNHPDKELHIGNHKFTCPLEYLHHTIKNPQHEHIDTSHLSRSIPKIEKQLEQQMEQQLQHQMIK